METKQISQNIRAGVLVQGDKKRFYAFLKMKHMKKDRVFTSTEALELALIAAQDHEAAEIKRIKEKAAARQESLDLKKKTNLLAAQDCVVGQIYYSTWGYDQTNVDFYQVVFAKGQTAVLRLLKKEKTSTGSMSGRAVAKVGVYVGDPLRKKIVSYNGKPAFSSPNGGLITLWDGKPVGYSEYA